MSSKKIWAASLAAVIAGSTFAVVATAADTVDPGASGEVTSNGIKVNVKTTSAHVEKIETDGTTLKITPKKTAYTVKDADKTNLTVTLSEIKEGYSMVKGDLSGSVNEKGEAELTIKDYDLKGTAGKSTDYTVTLMGADKDDVKVTFTVKNVGEFKEPTYTVKGKSDAVTKIDTSKPSDADVIVVYDPAKVTGASAYDAIDLTITGSGVLNGDTYRIDEKFNVGEDFSTPSSGGYTKMTLEWKNVKDDKDEVVYSKEVSFHFVTEEDYADLPEESKPADESKDESKDESTSSETTVEKEVTVDVEVGDVTDAGLVLDPAKIFTGDAATASWADVQEIKFTSDKPFALVFSVEKGAVKDKADAETFTKGVDAYKALDEAALATEQTLTAEDAAHVAKSTAKTVTLQTAEGETATVKATVKVKVKTTDTAPNTGIALAIAPAALATAFVTVAAVMSKKKKG